MATDKRPSVSEILSTAGEGTVEAKMDRIMRASPIGQVSSAIGDSFYGLNHRQQPGAISINKDYYGLTFFTRPRLNLTTPNVRAIRQLTPLLTNEAASIQRIIRCLLDPELARGSNGLAQTTRGLQNQTTNPVITSPFVDPQQPFIPILTNNLLSMNGWPDVIAPTHTSQEGVYKEAFSLVDGVTANYSTYDITANFRNIPGDPITLLFLVWLHYSSLVFQGAMTPYPDMIIQNEIDYQTRIYRLILDPSKTRVQKIAACGAAFPLNAPIGAAFNFEADRPINNANDQISINFRCMGAMYQDDILVDEFNRMSEIFNGSFVDGVREQYYQKVPMDALSIFNNRGYPRIDPNTYELQWWVSNEDFADRLPIYNDQKKLREAN